MLEDLRFNVVALVDCINRIGLQQIGLPPCSFHFAPPKAKETEWLWTGDTLIEALNKYKYNPKGVPKRISEVYGRTYTEVGNMQLLYSNLSLTELIILASK